MHLADELINSPWRCTSLSGMRFWEDSDCTENDKEENKMQGRERLSIAVPLAFAVGRQAARRQSTGVVVVVGNGEGGGGTPAMDHDLTQFNPLDHAAPM